MAQIIPLALPSDRDTVIQVQPMNVGQISQLYSPKYRGAKGLALLSEKIIPACCEGLPRAFDDLFVGDGAAIFLALRRASYGDEMDYKIRCSNCSKESSNFVDLSQIEMKYLEPDEDGNRRTEGFTFEYLHRGQPRTYTFHLPTNAEQKQAEKEAQQLNEKYGEIDFSNVCILSIAIDSVSGVTNGLLGQARRQAIIEHVFHADVDFLDAFREAQEEVSCGFESIVKNICSSCGEENLLDLPLIESFFSVEEKKLRRERMKRGSEEGLEISSLKRSATS